MIASQSTSPDIVERLHNDAPSMGYGGCQDFFSVLQEEEDRLRSIEGLRMGDVAMAFQRMRKRLGR